MKLTEPERSVLEKEVIEIVFSELSKLTKIKRSVVLCRIMGYTLNETGAFINRSQERSRQIDVVTRRKIKKKLQQKLGNDFLGLLY